MDINPMAKDVLVSIKGVQLSEYSFPEVTELVTTGRYYYSDSYSSITYVDTETDSDHIPTNTELHIEKDKVLLVRQGAICSQILFEEGKRNFSVYKTEVGSLMIGVGVHRIKQKLNPAGGELELDYSVEIDHAVAGENRFSIKIKELSPSAGSSYHTGTKIKS